MRHARNERLFCALRTPRSPDRSSDCAAEGHRSSTTSRSAHSLPVSHIRIGDWRRDVSRDEPRRFAIPCIVTTPATPRRAMARHDVRPGDSLRHGTTRGFRVSRCSQSPRTIALRTELGTRPARQPQVVHRQHRQWRRAPPRTVHRQPPLSVVLSLLVFNGRTEPHVPAGRPRDVNAQPMSAACGKGR